MIVLLFARKKYRLSCSRVWYGHVELAGPGLLIPVCLPAGTTLDDGNLRDLAIVAIVAARERRRDAREYIQQRQRDGKA